MLKKVLNAFLKWRTLFIGQECIRYLNFERL